MQSIKSKISPNIPLLLQVTKIERRPYKSYKQKDKILSQKTSLNSLFSSNLFFTRKKKIRNDPTGSNFQNSPYTKSIVYTMQLDEKRRIEGKGGARQESDEKRETLEGLFGEAASESRSPCWKFEIVTVSSARIIRSGHNAAVDV